MPSPALKISSEHPTVVGLEYRIAELERRQDEQDTRSHRQSSAQRWLIGILVTVGLFLGGLAYTAHAELAERLIEVGTKQGETLARIEERLNALQGRLDREIPTRSRSRDSVGTP